MLVYDVDQALNRFILLGVLGLQNRELLFELGERRNMSLRHLQNEAGKFVVLQIAFLESRPQLFRRRSLDIEAILLS